jgi:hypothetical protein
MPRKRKYMDPAGSTAGEAASLPPSTQTQPDPKCSRTRRPGDKWLKTAWDEGSHGGFRYESVHDNRSYLSRSGSPTSGGDRGYASDDTHVTESEIKERTQLLSPASQSLFCWEAPGAIRKGTLLGDKNDAWKRRYTFNSHYPTPVAAACPEVDCGPHVEAQQPPPSGKRWQWWWYQAQPIGFKEEFGAESSVQDICSVKNLRGVLETHPIPITDTDDSRDSLCSESNFQGGQKPVGAAAVLLDSRPEHMQGILVKNEDGNGHRFVPFPPTAAAAVAPDRGNAAGELRISDARRFTMTAVNGSPQPAVRPVMALSGVCAAISGVCGPMPGSPGACYRGGSQGKNRAPQSAAAALADSAAGRAKRVWRRWDPAEEQALREAVDVLGTKDWAAIHERMRTDRSIKQVMTRVSRRLLLSLSLPFPILLRRPTSPYRPTQQQLPPMYVALHICWCLSSPDLFTEHTHRCAAP